MGEKNSQQQGLATATAPVTPRDGITMNNSAQFLLLIFFSYCVFVLFLFSKANPVVSTANWPS